MNFYEGISDFEARSDGSLVWGNQSGLGFTVNETFYHEIDSGTYIGGTFQTPYEISFTALANGNMLAVWGFEVLKDQDGDGLAQEKDGDLFYRIFNPNNGNFVTNEVQFTQGPSTTLGLIEGTYVFDSYREGLSGISVDNNGGFTIRYNADLPVTMFDGEQGEFYTYSPMDGIIIGNPVEPPEQEINMQDILNGNPSSPITIANPVISDFVWKTRYN